MSRSDYRVLLAAILTDDVEGAKRAGRRVGEVTWNDSGLLVAALFSLVIKGRFKSDSGADAVREFIAQALREFTVADIGINPLVVEGVVRAALGEEDLLDGIAPLEGMQAQIALMHKVLGDADISRDQLDALLDQAERLLDEV